MRRKTIFALLFLIVMLTGSVMNVFAAGVRDIFDADFYAGKYNDLRSAYGTDEEELLKHFLTRGAGEGRVMNPILDVVAYRAAYADLNAAFGDDWNAYVNHYFTYGIAEKRTSGVLFDLAAYAEGNPYIKAACGDDYVAVARYYIRENKAGSGIVMKAVGSVSRSLTESGEGGTGSADLSDEDTAAADSSDTEISKEGTSESEIPAQKAPAKENSASNEFISNMAVAGAFAAEHIHNWILVSCRAATCVEDGYNDYCCQDIITYTDAAGNVVATLTCKETMREDVKAAHTRPDDVTYSVPPTCTQSGIADYNCTVCGEAVREELTALGHDYDRDADKPVRSKASTCKEAGRDIFLCKRCGAEIAEERPLAEHTVAEWVTDQDASCASEGKRHGRCSVCKAMINESTEKTGHINVENRNVFENAYQVGTSVRHSVQNITYCKDCGYILAASEPSYVNCADAGNGRCCTCNLEVTREASDAVKIYKAGDIYSWGQ